MSHNTVPSAQPRVAPAALAIHTAFNLPFSCARHDVSDPAWIAARIDLYLGYTVRSLQRQTEGGFTVWLDCRPGSENDLAPHMPFLLAAGVCVTFDCGEALLAELFDRSEAVYVTRIDSDDMYGPDAIAKILALHGDARASQFYGGYVYKAGSGQVFRVVRESPPFYTFRFTEGEIATASDIGAWTRLASGRRGHNVVRALHCPVRLPDARYCFVRHGHNNSLGMNDGQPIGDARALAEVKARFDLPIAVPAPRRSRLR